MPAKSNKYRIKVWMVADSSNGYVLNFDIYLGKEVDGRPHIYGLDYDVVNKLIRPFMNMNHREFFDNLFTSTTLLEHLETDDTFACGTVRCNRRDLPPCAKNKLRVGEKVARQKGYVVFTKWHDKRDVSVMANIVSPLVDDVAVDSYLGEIPKPAVIDVYKAMGGVDRADQLPEYYSVDGASYKWYRYNFCYLIHTSISNDFILCNFHRLGQNMGKLRQLNFRSRLAKQLIGGFSSTDLTLPKPKREFLKRSFKYSGEMLWNQLPREAKLVESIHSFNKYLKM